MYLFIHIIIIFVMIVAQTKRFATQMFDTILDLRKIEVEGQQTLPNQDRNKRKFATKR